MHGLDGADEPFSRNRIVDSERSGTAENTTAIYCKGVFLTDSLKALRFGSSCDDFVVSMKVFQGLRLVRKIK